MDDAWWGPSIPLPRRPVLLPGRAQPARLRPGQRGGPAVRQRVGPVRRRGARHVRRDTPEDPAHPGLADLRPALPRPLRVRRACRRASRCRAAGTRTAPWSRAGDARGLAGRPASTADALAKTVARFNEFAAAGRDEDFGRGDSAYDRYYGDPRLGPTRTWRRWPSRRSTRSRSCPATWAPRAGCAPTSRPGCCARTARAIEGLYAAGNASASVMGHSYAGAGATIGPAMTFGYLAALDLAAPSPPAQRVQEKKDEGAGGDAGAGGDQDRAVAGDLVDRGAADLADRLGDAVHAVDVGLAELAAVRVERQPAAQLDGAVGDEVPGLAARAEAELLQLHQHVRGEVVVEHGGPHVGRADPGLPPQLPGRPRPSPAGRSARRGSSWSS